MNQGSRRPAQCEGDVIEINAETYGPLKVTCENIIQEVYLDRCALLRPQVVAGAYDPLDRFSYWVRRATQGGPMLAPGDGSDYLQVIDAGDVARFTRLVCENGFEGSYNLAGPRLTWKEFMELLGARDIIWVAADTIREASLTEFELPLYRPSGGRRSSLMHVSNERAVGMGLTVTDPRVTVNNVRIGVLDHTLPNALTADREAELIGISTGFRGVSSPSPAVPEH